MRAADFVDTLGINTHIGSNPYNDPALIRSMLTYLGINNVRQSSPTDAAALANMQTLGQLGAKIDLIINGGGPVDLGGAMATVDQLAPYLNAVEGVNEAQIWPISYKGLGGVDAAVALQKDLYAAVKADPALANAAVYIFTLGGVDPGAFPSIGDLSAYTDYANVHSYPPHGLRPIFVIHAAIDGGRTDAPSKPIVITETGYYTLPQNDGWGGVPESVQASYLLDLVLDEAAAGVSRTYLYDLIDDGPDPAQANREDHFGLFKNDGTPKLAATSLHNLTKILADPSASSRSFALGSLAFTADGVPYDYTGNTMLLQKSDGTNVIAVWNEQQLWDPDTRTATEAKHVPVTVSLPQTYATVTIVDPLVGTDPIQTLHGVSAVTLDLTDHPLLIVVPPPVVPPAGPPSTSSSAGPVVSTLTLALSEDAWRGDAQAVVTVDGKQVGGAVTVTALHAQGKPQAVTLTGPWGAGTHDVGIQFINDAYGGTSATDRNLYVDGVSFNGRASVTPAAALYSNGTAHFATAAASPLVLQLSEDSYLGDAQFSVSVDGKALGGAQSVTALHGKGATQDFAFDQAMAAGRHDVAVSFLNDRYDGTAATDRNLYLDAIVVNGVKAPGTAATLLSAATQHVSVVVAAS